MKNLKLIIALFILTASFFGCNKCTVSPNKEEMTVEQLKTKLGIDLIGMWDQQFGTARTNGKKPKADAVVVVWFNDLVLTEPTDNNFSSTVSENAQWFGYQVFVNMTTNDGAYSTCNHYYASQAESPDNEPCTITGTGFVRTFTSDFDYNIHISNVISN